MKTSTLFLASRLATASAFAPTTHQPCTPSSSSALSASRREAMEKFGAAAFSAAVLISGGQPAQVASKVATEEAEFNELINVLKTRSDDNKEKEANANCAMRADKMSSKDFTDAKSRRPKLM